MKRKENLTNQTNDIMSNIEEGLVLVISERIHCCNVDRCVYLFFSFTFQYQFIISGFL